MTIMTPDEARALLDGTKPGPWYCRDDAGLLAVVSDAGPVAIDVDEAEIPLIVAAPTLAAMIAGMRAEYRAEYQAPFGHWFPTDHCRNYRNAWVTKQEAERNAADWKADGYPTRIVRRYFTDPEVIA